MGKCMFNFTRNCQTLSQRGFQICMKKTPKAKKEALSLKEIYFKAKASGTRKAVLRGTQSH